MAFLNILHLLLLALSSVQASTSLKPRQSSTCDTNIYAENVYIKLPSSSTPKGTLSFTVFDYRSTVSSTQCSATFTSLTQVLNPVACGQATYQFKFDPNGLPGSFRIGFMHTLQDPGHTDYPGGVFVRQTPWLDTTLEAGQGSNGVFRVREIKANGTEQAAPYDNWKGDAWSAC